jgi:hypothetical protein
MDDLSRRTAREVLDDHLTIVNDWAHAPFERILEKDLGRNVSEDVVVLTNRGAFHGHGGVRHLARMLFEELPEHRAFEYTHVAADERVALLEWTYEDDRVRVGDGVDSYLIENGKIVGQTIRYTVETKKPT